MHDWFLPKIYNVLLSYSSMKNKIKSVYLKSVYIFTVCKQSTTTNLKEIAPMKKLVQIIFPILLIVGFTSCKEEMQKQTLGSDYYLMGYKENPASIKLVHSIGDSFEDVILGEIVDCNKDPKFILIHRKITDKAKALFEELPLWSKQNKYQDQYWIIDKVYDGINGPLNYKDYIARRKELQVSEGISLK